MHIRPLQKEDVFEVESIFNLYWSGDFLLNLSKRLHSFVSSEPEVREQQFRFFVATEDGKIVGVAAMRTAPEHMRTYVKTANPAEFYVLAVRERGKGIGTALRSERIAVAKQSGYTEAVFFSGETHKDSWGFHDRSDFKRVGMATAPDGESGYIWRMEF